MPGNLPISLWVAIFAVGILLVYLMYLFSSALLREIWGDEGEQNSDQPRDD